jgi:hypothetical protein
LFFSRRFHCPTKDRGLHLILFIVKHLPVLPPNTYGQSCAWTNGHGSLRDWLVPRLLELTYTAWELDRFGKVCGWFGPRFIWDEARRFQLRSELDAAFFHLYGINPGDTSYIFDTFLIMCRKEGEKYGTYRTKDAILHIYDAMDEAARTGSSYQSLLDRPPADQSICHSPR